jgi:hypothetical protein
VSRQTPCGIKRTVHRGGLVRFGNSDYHASELARLEGERVVIAPNPTHADSLTVTRHGRFLCTVSRIDDDDDPGGARLPVPPRGGAPGGVAGEPDSTFGWSQSTELDHYRGLTGAAVVSTESLLLADVAIRDAVDEFGICALMGDAGLGKTFAMQSVLRGLRYVALSFPSEPTPRENVAVLYEAVTGRDAGRMTRYSLERALKQALCRSQIIVVDEAETLTVACLSQLRQLHEDPSTKFALVLIGDATCRATIKSDPRLASRIDASVDFHPMTEADVLAGMPGYHAIYAEVPGDLLLRINQEYAMGRFRLWAKFTHIALRRCADQGRDLDDDMITAVMATIPAE